jgi:hypothetical protein
MLKRGTRKPWVIEARTRLQKLLFGPRPGFGIGHGFYQPGHLAQVGRNGTKSHQLGLSLPIGTRHRIVQPEAQQYGGGRQPPEAAFPIRAAWSGQLPRHRLANRFRGGSVGTARRQPLQEFFRVDHDGCLANQSFNRAKAVR